MPNTDYYIDDTLLKRDVANFAESGNQVRGLKLPPVLTSATNKDLSYFNAVDFYGKETFTGEYTIENPQDYTVLVVQDDLNVFDRTISSLKKKGFNVLEAKDGEKAVSILNATKKAGNKIHFVFIDTFVSYVNGYKIAEKIEKEGYDTITILSSGMGEKERHYKQGFDFQLSASGNDMLNAGDFISYLIQKYGFKGTPKKKPSSDNTIGASQTYYIEQNQNLIAPEQLSKPVEQAKLTTEIKEEQNPLLFLSDSPAIQPNTSSASALLLFSIILFSKIGVGKAKDKTDKKKKSHNIYYTEDVKSQEEKPLNIKVKIDPNLRQFRRYDRIVFDKEGIAYYRGDKGTKVMSNFYMTISNKQKDLKLLVRAVKNSKLASPFEIKMTFSQYDKADFQRVLLYDSSGNVLNINILLPEGVLTEGEGIMFYDGAFYTFDKETLKRKEKLDRFSLRVPKKQIPNLTEVFSDSQVSLTLHMVPNRDKAQVVYREAMLTNVSLGKTFSPIAKKELNLTDTQASGLMLGIQYFIPMLSLIIKPVIRWLGEKNTLLTALGFSALAGVMVSVAGFNGFVHDVVRSPWQQGVFVAGFILMSLSTLLRQMVSTILIRDNTGVVKETESNINNDNIGKKGKTFSFKKENKFFKKIFKRNGNKKNIYSIPVELIFSKAFVWKSIGTLAFLIFPFVANKFVYLISSGTINPNFDYALSFPFFAALSIAAAIRTYKTNLRNRTADSKENKEEKPFIEKVKSAYASAKKGAKAKKEELKQFKYKENRKAWIKENNRIIRYFFTLTLANAHEFVVSTALALQLSNIFKDSATSNFYTALGLYAPLLLGRLIFNFVRGKTSSATSFTVFTGLALLGTLMMFLHPTSQVMLMLGAGIACLGTGNCFTLLYTDVTKGYSKEKELTISSLGSVAVVFSALLTLVAPELIERGHFQGALLYGLCLISAVAILSLPAMKDSPLIKAIKDMLGLTDYKYKDSDTQAKPKKKNPFEDMGKWWHAPKNRPDMNNPEPQN